ncbi:ABC transporter substrate-binding protein [Megasphaera sp. UBA4233]|uniref:ABC transporter substrate-binding protein n=3 Tax=Megasphaera TaxID=906 RepID=UPI0025BBA0A3|nr:ABC transporter substrate-binding protein [Megasphaera sp. UBA4233]
MFVKRWMYTLVVLVCMIMAGSILSGCSTEKKDTSAAAVMTFTDLENRNVSLDKMPEKFVVGDYITNFLLVGGAPSLDKVVGVTADGWQDVRYGEYQVFTKAFPRLKTGESDSIPSIGGYHDNVLNAEKILSLKPDVLIIDKSQFAENNQAIENFEKAGIRVVVLDYHSETLENHVKSTEILGKLLGREEVAQKQIDTYKNAVEEVYRRVDALPDSQKHKKVYMEIGNKGTREYGNSYNNNFLWGAIIHRVGGDNISGNMKTTYGALDKEFVTSENPDVIIIGGSIWAKDTKNDQMRMGFTVDEKTAQKRLRGFASIPEWQHLKAVQDGEVYGVDHGSLRTMADYTFTQYIAKILYPEAFADMDPQKNMNDFYATFLPELTYTGTFMIKLEK